MFHKEGHKIILLTFVFVVVSVLLVDNFMQIPWLQLVLEISLLLLLILILQFFRNPKRQTNLNDNQVLAPVDGKVVVIEERHVLTHNDIGSVMACLREKLPAIRGEEKEP